MCSKSIRGFKIHSLNTLSNAFKWQRGWKPISFVWSDPVLPLRHEVYFAISSTSQDRLVWRPLTHAGTLGATCSSSTCIIHRSSRIITTTGLSFAPPLPLPLLPWFQSLSPLFVLLQTCLVISLPTSYFP